MIEDEPGMLQSAGSLGQLLSAELDAGIPSERIVMCGFSQGGAMSFLIGLTTTRRLGGIAVLSGWLPLKDKIKAVGSTSAEGSLLWYKDNYSGIDSERIREEDATILGPWDRRYNNQVHFGAAVDRLSEERT